MLASAVDEIIAALQANFPAALASVAASRGVTLDTPGTYEKWFDWRSSARRPAFPVVSVEWSDSLVQTYRPYGGVRDSWHKVTIRYYYKSTSASAVETHAKHIGEALMVFLDNFPTASRLSGKSITKIAPPLGQDVRLTAMSDQIREDSGTTFELWQIAIEFTVEVRDPVTQGGAVATVTVSPNPITSLAPLATQQLVVTLKDASNNILTGRYVAFVSDNNAIATVSPSGVVTGVANGSVNIFVGSEGIWTTVPVTISSGSFDPSQLPNLELWLKGDAGITIGTGVSQWADQSGNGRNFTQATGAKQPLNSNTLNGRAVVTFQRANSQYLQQSAGPSMPSGPCSVFIVYKLRSTPAGSALWNLYHFISDSKVEEAIVFGNGNGFGNFNFLGEAGPSGGTALRTIPDAWDTNAHSLSMLFSGKYSLNNASYAIRKDETTKVVSVNGGGNYGVSGLSVSSLGAYRNDLEAQFMDGDIGELIHVSRVCTGGEVALVEAYITARWGV